ncbi:type II toxin-antitoxin system VapC family toxin [Psychrobacter lutiphocae]|uniref:type II toxin-antitoxin system VapC family toxin n=1 Tax=Psychrobacter lutiphocae TaxID=540500 RepID=UPI00035F2A4D|nr:type II toxin-antitoxin system VapC family toxin [Psychrobacter lutiphocae]
MVSYIFDTNALIHANQTGVFITPQKHHISVITELELLSYANLSTDDEQHLKQILAQFQTHTITQSIKLQTINIRRLKKLKLPDSIIVATAEVLGCTLVTNDRQILNAMPDNSVAFEDVSLVSL